jgi:hypothetical protein
MGQTGPPVSRSRPEAVWTAGISPPASPPTTGRAPSCSSHRREPSGAQWVARRARHRARRRAWRLGGAGCRRPANSDREEPRGEVSETRGASAVLVRSRSGREVAWRGAAHGAGCSGELGRNSGELLPRREAESWRAVASTGRATTRRSEGEDGGGGGESERRLRRLRSSGAGDGEAELCCCCCGRARENGGSNRGGRARGGGKRARTLRGPQGACRAAPTACGHAAAERCRGATTPRAGARAGAGGRRRRRGPGRQRRWAEREAEAH